MRNSEGKYNAVIKLVCRGCCNLGSVSVRDVKGNESLLLLALVVRMRAAMLCMLMVGGSSQLTTQMPRDSTWST
jgi:hypothetical protein